VLLYERALSSGNWEKAADKIENENESGAIVLLVSGSVAVGLIMRGIGRGNCAGVCGRSVPSWLAAFKIGVSRPDLHDFTLLLKCCGEYRYRSNKGLFNLVDPATADCI
jgi:hypothetical protein